MKHPNYKGIALKLVILWSSIVLMGFFWLTAKGAGEPVSLSVLPQVPRENEPIVATFKLNNPSSQQVVTRYQFFANGHLLKEGMATIMSDSSNTYSYTYENPLELGSQVTFLVRTQSDLGSYEKLVSTPAYPPQVWSSFVSFASFSTSVMSSISTMTYYQGALGGQMGLNVGLVCAAVLLGLLMFLELSRPVLQNKTIAVLGNMKLRFGTVTWILLIVFLGVIYTKVALLISM